MKVSIAMSNDCELIPVTQDNLDIVSKLTVEFDFPRSENWIRRALFNPYVAPCDKSARRGYMLKSSDDGYVGILCYSPMRLFLKDQPVIGYSGLLLGIKKRYGEWLLDLFNAVKEDEKGCLAFGNTSCSARATRICCLARGDKTGPDECCYSRVYRYCIGSYILALSRRMLLGRLQSLIWGMTWPVRMIDWGVRRIFYHSPFVLRREYDFMTSVFEKFWTEYLKTNEGLVSSREPKILNHLFGESLRAGRLVLLTASDSKGLVGYVVLRKYLMFKTSNVLKYKIVDAIALNNDFDCLRDLVRAAKIFAVGHSGERVEYIGGNPGLEQWIDNELNRKHSFGFNTTTYFYTWDDVELRDAIDSRRGWFFGPFDGERCLGHAGFIDL